MTRIKYATVYRLPEESRLILKCGSDDETLLLMRLNDETEEYEQVTAKRVDEIPLSESKSPTEYRLWAESNAEDILAN